MNIDEMIKAQQDAVKTSKAQYEDSVKKLQSLYEDKANQLTDQYADYIGKKIVISWPGNKKENSLMGVFKKVVSDRDGFYFPLIGKLKTNGAVSQYCYLPWKLPQIEQITKIQRYE